jgi:hypothetical protein
MRASKSMLMVESAQRTVFDLAAPAILARPGSATAPDPTATPDTDASFKNLRREVRLRFKLLSCGPLTFSKEQNNTTKEIETQIELFESHIGFV